jgi:OHCU decarboxylase
MALSVSELDTMPEARAAELLASCCGSANWVKGMLTRRPFQSRDTLLEVAERVWQELTPADWLEAFSHHPRIGAPDAHGWAAEEQSGMDAAADSTRAKLMELNRQHEAKFGYIYIVSATGKSAAELLEIAHARLANPPGVELAVAALEQQRITRLRLERMFQ